MSFDLSGVGIAELVAFTSLAGTALNFVMRPGKDAGDSVRTLAETVDELESRVAVIESEIHHLPDRSAVHSMELAFRDLKGEVAVLVARVEPMAATTARVQEFLLEQAKGGR